MLLKLENFFSGNWKILFYVLFFPVAWVPWLFEDTLWLVILKVLFLFIPVLFIIVAFWFTIFSFLTVFFRPRRVNFIATILITWWDGGKAILMYWGGIFRFVFLSFGWIWGSLRIVIVGTYYTLREILFLPFTMIKGASENYLRPGIPWLAITLTFGWIILEGIIFSVILTGMTTEIIAQLTDSVPSEAVVRIGLFLFLSVVIGGSFACMHGLVEAISERSTGDIFKMLVVEVCVMLFEVMFLYREFVDSLAPWIAQATGDKVHLGPGPVILIAGLAWLGVRASTWFLFAKFGTPTLLTIISREGVASSGAAGAGASTVGTPLQWIKTIVSNLQSEINWFSEKGNELIDAFVIPPVQILAVMTNFCMVFLTSRTLFNLPLKTVGDIKETRELIDEITNHGVQ